MQVVIALVVTPEGFPLAYEVVPGNTSDKTTLRGFLKKIEEQYGKAERVWLMDRGVPTEEVLAEMRASDPPIQYLVGTPKVAQRAGSQTAVRCRGESARRVSRSNSCRKESELYILAQSRDRIAKERAMRRRALRRLLARLGQLRKMKPKRDQLLMKIGEAKAEAGRAAFALVDIHLPAPRQAVSEESFRFAINRQKLRTAYRREGRYLLRSNRCDQEPGEALGTLHATHADRGGLQDI